MFQIQDILTRFIFSFGLLTLLYSCSQPESKHTPTVHFDFTNELINESSPYLLQHAHNPVNWYPWGEKALNKAKTENKPLLISIGYAACHWCHVMEHESFENQEVAKLMNDNFICIKVDREERPDVDQVYMDAVQLLTGGGGWPLNAIALPDGRPFFAGTYFPKEDWTNVLKKIAELYQTDKPRLEGIATELTQGIKTSDLEDIAAEKKAVESSDITTAIKNWKRTFDSKEGGYSKAPKFPLPKSWDALLNYYQLTKDQEVLQQITLTLDKMAFGGIYDQIGGGFSRYATDKQWKVPHFEKMLYDNAQLISLYSHAYQVTQKPLYKRIVFESIEFLEREMLDKTGGFYSSLDADSEGEEGKFYVWTKTELDQLLGEDASWFINYTGVLEKGNWDGLGNILYIQDSNLGKIAKVPNQVAHEKLLTIKKKLLKERSKRIRPGLDDKVLTAWNALTLKAYLDAYQAFGDEKLLKTAHKSAQFLLTHAKQDGYRLNRNFKDGKSSINAFLDDYALVIDAFVSMYESTFEEKWLTHAKGFMDYAIQNFYDTKSGYFHYTSTIDKQLIARKLELSDNVIPSSNSVMANNLLRLGTYFYQDDYHQKSKFMLRGMKENVVKSAGFYANWFSLMLTERFPFYEVAIVGKDYRDHLQDFHRAYLPNTILLGGNTEGQLGLDLLKNKLVQGQTRIYVCKDKVCKLPVTSTDQALKQIK